MAVPIGMLPLVILPKWRRVLLSSFKDIFIVTEFKR